MNRASNPFAVLAELDEQPKIRPPTAVKPVMNTPAKLPADQEPQPIAKELPTDPLYKTQLCGNYAKDGKCRYGKSCRFAHGESELRARALGGASKGKSAKELPTDPLYKTQLCENYAQDGKCRYGKRCHFAHGDSELRAPPRFVAKELPTDPLYKTQLCQNYAQDGKCRYGDRCLFAHGDSELRSQPQQLPTDPLYKTKLCANFVRGECRYGERCLYAHGDSELRGLALRDAPAPPVTPYCSHCDEEGEHFPNECPYVVHRARMPKPRVAVVGKLAPPQLAGEDFPPLPAQQVLEAVPSLMRADAPEFVPRMTADAAPIVTFKTFAEFCVAAFSAPGAAEMLISPNGANWSC